MNLNLTPTQLRVVGCMMEKSITTPEQYPLTLNALTNACNQKSSRDPVMQLVPGLVQQTARQLSDKHLVAIREGAKAGVEKYAQRLCNTLMAELKFSPAEFAIVTLLLLRGAQTPGELRARSGRLHTFAHNQDVIDALAGLMERDGGPLIARLAKKPGRQDHQYIHLFSGAVESVAQEASPQPRLEATGVSRMDNLEARIATLENALLNLADKLGEEISLGDGTTSNTEQSSDQ